MLLAKLEQSQQDALEVQQLSARVQRDAAYIKAADTKIAALTLELAHHRRLRFANKSEAFSPEQRDLFQETWNVDLAAIEAEVDQVAQQVAHPPKKARPTGRQPLPAHLPRIEHRHEPATCTCASCGGNVVKIGEDVSEQLDVEPAQFFVHRHIRPQYACRICDTVTAEAIPAAVIQGSLGAPGLHAWVAVQKFLDHLPLYRIEQISERYGVPIARSTLAEWIGRIGVALQPLADRLAQLVRQRAILHADETPVAQLDPGNGRTKRAYLWAYRSNDLDGNRDPPIIVFDYQPNRSGSHAQHFLHDWRGSLMVDDYGGYKALFQCGITELGCFAHARRKFFDLHAANQSPIAARALERIGALYAVEREGKPLDTEARRQLRQTQAQPILDALHTWLLATRRTAADGSGLAKAIDYSLKRWPALVRYAHSGDLPIDNNPIENAIRPIAIGKKNWLFAGSERAGKRAAAIQTLLGTAKLNGIEPCAWLKDVLEKLPTWPNRRIDELLPLRSTSST
ncbi:MAG: IS66 family transposase [Blastocatellia bacterium]|nr:IS66 family transposase [Blastocatellia bacterium]